MPKGALVVAITTSFGSNEKEALLIMFGPEWRKKFWTLDGQKGRPSIADCIDFALRKRNSKVEEDLVNYLENYLTNMARRCERSAREG